MKAFIVYPSYRIKDNKAQVMLFGRMENGESFCTIHDFKPYFWIREEDVPIAKKLLIDLKTSKVEISNSKFKNFEGVAVSKVTLTIPREVPELRKILQDNNITCYEADIRFSYRFMFDHDIMISMNISGDSRKPTEEDGLFVDKLYENPKIEPCDFWPKLKTLSIDIETDLKASKIFSVSLYSDTINKVLIQKQGKFKNAESFLSEKELLEEFQKLILKEDPDVIIGWNVIDFDFKVLKKLFSKHLIQFKLGRMDRECSLRLTDSFFIDSSANFLGRCVIDGIHLLKVSFLRLDDYKLNTAAKSILGDEKLLTSDSRAHEIEELYEKDPQKLIDYNLKDSVLVDQILEKSNTLNLSIKRSLLTGMQVDRVNASIASLDSMYLRELKKLNVVAPSAYVMDAGERIKGGFVMSSKPGIYDGVIVLDFKSLYPSIIRTFNIDPYSFVPKPENQKNLVEAPNKAHFKNQNGILPNIIQSLWDQRDKAKKDKDQLASQAIKILMNSFFGVLANPTCRFYSLEVANAITHFGQYINKLTAKKIEEKGYKVIYGDTDSLFINIDSIDEAKNIGSELQEYINDFYNKFVQENYNRKSFLELEYEKVYLKFLMPKVRGSDTGAKKRYAGLILKDGKEEIIFTGLEFVRRDWTSVSKKFQIELLDNIFHDKPVDLYIKNFVADLKSGKKDDLLVYKKAIRKGVSEYTKTTPPHIKAARKIGRELPGIIEYVITINGPEPLEKTHSKLDYDHYIEKQIRPIADSVLSFQDKTFDEIVSKHKQTSLAGFT